MTSEASNTKQHEDTKMIDANQAIQFIQTIASYMADTKIRLSDIIDVLEDGEALASLGVTDEESELVEMAHGIVTEWYEKHDFLSQCQF